MFDTLLYVSFSNLFMPDDEGVVEDIVHYARKRNVLLDVTGALIFTHQRFAQYLEGPEAGVADLMASIRRDHRHRDIKIVASSRAGRRQFRDWDMAYAGPSDFVGKQVDALVGVGAVASRSDSSEHLIRMMAEFARHDQTYS